MASLSQGRTAAAQCGLFTYKPVLVIFEPPCIYQDLSRHYFKQHKWFGQKCVVGQLIKIQTETALSYYVSQLGLLLYLEDQMLAEGI